MDVDTTMEKKAEKKTEETIPFEDNSFVYTVNIKLVGVFWVLMLFLKIICLDEEWMSFLLFTALLLICIFPFFFITKETFMFKIQGSKTDDKVQTRSSTIPSPTSSVSGQEIHISERKFFPWKELPVADRPQFIKEMQLEAKKEQKSNHSTSSEDSSS